MGNFIGPVLYGVRSAASDYGCNLLIAGGMDDYTVLSRPAWPEPDPDVDFVPVGPWNVDGLIVVNPLLSPDKSAYIAKVRHSGMPVVFISTGEDGPTVCVDNETGIRRAVAHLVEHGHRSIAFIAGYPQDLKGDSAIRLKAYQDAVRENGLTADPRLVAYSCHSIDGGKSAMQQLLTSGLKFTAAIASNDESAIGAMCTLRDVGLRIPEDIAIIGFDDSLEALMRTPPLTTLHYSPSEMGYTALELLLEYVAGRQPVSEIVKIPARMVLRQSCGCLSGINPDAGVLTPVVVSMDRSSAMSQLVKAMTENAMAEAQHLGLAEVHALCSRLVETLVSSLKSGQPKAFYRTIDDIRFRTEAAEEDVHIWHAALTALENKMELLLMVGSSMMKLHQAEDMLRHSRLMINESVRRQSRRYMVRQRWRSDWMGRLNASLLTALDRTQIFAILAERFAKINIQNAGVAFFEPQEGDPFAVSELHRITPAQEDVASRFPSRQFPPPGMFAEPFSLILLPLSKQGDAPGFVVFDTSHLDLYALVVWQLRTFFKVAGLYQEATEGRRLAEEAASSKNRFLAMVSHELRTPLSLILGLSELLLRDDADVTISRSDLENIRSNARQLDVLIRDVLDLAQAEAGEWKLQCEQLDFAEVLQPVSMVGEQLARKKGLDWSADIPAVLPLVWGDCIRLRQIVMNLINNATKFTESGSVRLQVEAGDGGITVLIHDTGPGIPLEEQETIFTEFRQCGHTAAQRSDGLGLGLAICKRLVELHGGTIGVDSTGKDGEGTTIYFRIPASQTHTATSAGTLTDILPFLDVKAGQELSTPVRKPGKPIVQAAGAGKGALSVRLVHLAGETQKAKPEPLAVWKIPTLPDSCGETVPGAPLSSVPVWLPAHSVGVLHKPASLAELAEAVAQRWPEDAHRENQRILIVDDDIRILETFTRMLRDWSPQVEVLTAQRGADALASIHRHQPDLVLLDLAMPEMDGFEVLESMRHDPASRDIPVIILSGQKLTQETIRRLNTGVETILHKDLYSVDEVSTHIETILHGEKDVNYATHNLARKAMAYIHEQFTEPLSLEHIATYFGVCKEHLARCFRDETGITVGTYLNRYRISQAKELLRQEEKRVVDVAMQVGFSSSAYFSRVFKQETGKSPQEYRQRH
ncbi:MAG: substrate-binding domain-containing protein [Chloroflexota bacterium]